jgi:phosphate starvation-inducible PhoH-like protein
MEIEDGTGKLKKNKKNKKYTKDFKKDMVFDLQCYEKEKEANNDLKIYKNIQYLSDKEKTDFENKFSKPRNKSQTRFLKNLKNQDCRIILASGPAGTGKTLFGIEQGIRNYILGNFEKLIFTRPVVAVDEDIGYLPGTLEEKMSPWIRPIFDILYNYITPKEVEYLISEKVIEISPLGFMRGRTFKNCWIVADEMQNSTVSQMKMLLTRIGEKSRLVITGDLDQNDRHHEINGLEDFLNKIRGRRSDSISSVEFEKSDIERENVVREVLEIYEVNDLPYSYQKKSVDSEDKNKTESSIDTLSSHNFEEQLADHLIDSENSTISSKD